MINNSLSRKCKCLIWTIGPKVSNLNHNTEEHTEQKYKRNRFDFAPIFHELCSKIYNFWMSTKDLFLLNIVQELWMTSNIEFLNFPLHWWVPLHPCWSIKPQTCWVLGCHCSLCPHVIVLKRNTIFKSIFYVFLISDVFVAPKDRLWASQ